MASKRLVEDYRVRINPTPVTQANHAIHQAERYCGHLTQLRQLARSVHQPQSKISTLVLFQIMVRNVVFPTNIYCIAWSQTTYT